MSAAYAWGRYYDGTAWRCMSCLATEHALSRREELALVLAHGPGLVCLGDQDPAAIVASGIASGLAEVINMHSVTPSQSVEWADVSWMDPEDGGDREAWTFGGGFVRLCEVQS